ncbi:hypothetical protein Tco_0754939 [Tanacetum coccineum]
MTGDHSRLRNFMQKFIETVRFRNDHFGAIMGYRDYVIGDSVISRVYYVEGLGHNLLSVRQFCDSDLEVAFRKHSCWYLSTKIYSDNSSTKWCCRKTEPYSCKSCSDDADFSKALMFLWAEDVATAWHVPNLVLSAPYVLPTNKEIEILFQPMFDEYLEPLRVKRPVPLALTVQVPVNSAGTPSSTTIDKDAPYTSHSLSSSTLQSPSLHQGIAAGSTIIEDNPFAPQLLVIMI